MQLKRVIQTFKAPQQWTNTPPGLGDFVRGICYLHEILQGSGIELRVDVSQTEFVDLIEQSPSFFWIGAKQSIANAEEHFIDHPAAFDRLKEFFESDETEFYISTNIGNWDRVEIPEKTLQFARNFFAFTPHVEHLNANQLASKEYETLSIRCGDVFYKDPSIGLIEEAKVQIRSIIEEHVLPRAIHPIAVTSDCYELKQELAKRYGMMSLPYPSQHGAYGNALPVAMDLCLLKNSRCNYHINIWAGWWSGFSHYTSMIFHIPSFNFRMPDFAIEEVTADGRLIMP